MLLLFWPNINYQLLGEFACDSHIFLSLYNSVVSQLHTVSPAHTVRRVWGFSRMGHRCGAQVLQPEFYDHSMVNGLVYGKNYRKLWFWTPKSNGFYAIFQETILGNGEYDGQPLEFREKMFLTRLDKPTDRSSPSAHDQCLTSRVSCTIQVNLLSQSRQLPNPSPKPHFLQGEWMTCWRFPDHIRYPSQVWLSRWFSWRRMVPTSGESAKRHRDGHLATASRGNDHRFFNPCDVGCPREIETLYSTHTHIYINTYIHIRYP